jgi:thiol-disulfide isomerase/thioredoxin
MKILNKLAAVALSATALLAACTAPAPTSYTVTGILPDSSMNGKEVFISPIRSKDFITSTTVDGNKFTFEGVADSAIYCSAQIKGTRTYSEFVLENGNITLDFTAERVIPTGTESNNIIGDLYAVCDTMLKENIEAISKEWFAKHNNDVISLVLFGSPLYFVLDADGQIATLEGLGENIKEVGYIKKELNRLKARKATEVGQPYTDFEGKDAAGNPVKLSDYVGKGNYVLVDMWASWCGPCKREIPNLAEVHNLYKDKGLTVLGIFVWDDVKNLEPTLKAENVTWAQIIDTEKVSTDTYGVNGIPSIMLIGPDGTILERDRAVRGENMKPTIEKYLLNK